LESSPPAAPDRSFTVKGGHNLSKISNRSYGSPNHYSNISESNEIQFGQQITVRPLI
jgi:nucleoid-associated protein YgaU